MKKTVVLPIVVMLLSLLALACGGSSTTDNEANVPSVTEKNPSQTTSGTGLGEPVEQGGYSLTVVGVEDPATPGASHNPSPGTRLIAVEIILRNESGARMMKVDPLNASLYDTDGAKYSADNRALDDPIERKDLNVGDEVRGKVAFNIKEDATPARFAFEFVFGNKVEVELQ
jgi:hypothetical protein